MRKVAKPLSERAREIYFEYANNLDCTESAFVAEVLNTNANTSSEIFDKVIRRFATGRLKTKLSHKKIN